MNSNLPGGSISKEAACNAGDAGLIPGSGRSPGEGNGYPLQYWCLGNPMDRGAWKDTVHGVTESDTTKQLLPPSVRALSTCLSLALLISSLYWPAQKFRVSFSMRCYRKTWTNLFANPILLPISRKREEEIVPQRDCLQFTTWSLHSLVNWPPSP